MERETPEQSREGMKEQEPRKVVRVFLYQSRSMEEIMQIKEELQNTTESQGGAIDYSRLFFTTVIWAEKSKESIQNQG